MGRRVWLDLVAGIGAAGAVSVGIGVGTPLIDLVRGALRTAPAIDDGADELLAPVEPSSRQMVRTPDGTALNVVTFGSVGDASDLIVAVHGWACETAYWNPQINHFVRRGVAVIAYDQRGHGHSELGTRRPTIDMLGQDLDAVLDAVVPSGRRAVVVGHSMGGMTIMSWAQQFRHTVAQKVSGVVLASTAAESVMARHRLFAAEVPRYSAPFMPILTKLLTESSIPLPRSRYRPKFTQYLTLGTAPRASHVAFVDAMIAACPPRARGRWGAAMASLDVTAGMAALTVPTTVVVGSADRLTPPEHAEQIAEALRRNGHLRDVLTIDGVGHMSTIEAAPLVNEAIEKVIASES